MLILKPAQRKSRAQLAYLELPRCDSRQRVYVYVNHQGRRFPPAGAGVRSRCRAVLVWLARQLRTTGGVEHDCELSARYGHWRACTAGIRVGARVSRGQIISSVGSSGLSTGPHLYYEIQNHGRRINPLQHRRLLTSARMDARERRQLDRYIDSVSC